MLNLGSWQLADAEVLAGTSRLPVEMEGGTLCTSEQIQTPADVHAMRLTLDYSCLSWSL